MKPGFEKFVSDKYKRTEFTKLKVGEVFYFKKFSTREYNRVYSQTRRNGREYSHLKIKNGVLIKREK